MGIIINTFIWHFNNHWNFNVYTHNSNMRSHLFGFVYIILLREKKSIQILWQ